MIKFAFFFLGFFLALPKVASAVVHLDNICPIYFEMRKDGLCYYPKSIHEQFPLVKDGFRPKVISLGKLLFFDPVLSQDQTHSCATCHDPHQGFADGQPRAHGRKGLLLERSTPSLWNVAFLKSYFWDGRAKTLEEQIKGPLFSPNEMASNPHLIEERLSSFSEYKNLFFEAFGTSSIKISEVIKALVTFERTLISFNSRYDDWARGIPEALSSKEIEGLRIFRSFVTRCWECHTPPLFTDEQMAIIETPEPSGKQADLGLASLTHDPRQIGSFRVPSLRNIALTAPYMHSGRFSSLTEVIHFYDSGGGRGPEGVQSPYLHWHIREIGLSKEEIEELIAFLGALTDITALPLIPSQVPSGLNLSFGENHGS